MPTLLLYNCTTSTGRQLKKPCRNQQVDKSDFAHPQSNPSSPQTNLIPNIPPLGNVKGMTVDLTALDSTEAMQ